MTDKKIFNVGTVGHVDHRPSITIAVSSELLGSSQHLIPLYAKAGVDATIIDIHEMMNDNPIHDFSQIEAPPDIEIKARPPMPDVKLSAKGNQIEYYPRRKRGKGNKYHR